MWRLQKLPLKIQISFFFDFVKWNLPLKYLRNKKNAVGFRCGSLAVDKNESVNKLINKIIAVLIIYHVWIVRQFVELNPLKSCYNITISLMFFIPYNRITTFFEPHCTWSHKMAKSLVNATLKLFTPSRLALRLSMARNSDLFQCDPFSDTWRVFVRVNRGKTRIRREHKRFVCR